MTPASPALIAILKTQLAAFPWTVASASSSSFTPPPAGDPLTEQPARTLQTLSMYCETPAQDFVLTAMADLNNDGSLGQLSIMVGGAMLDATDVDLWAQLAAMVVTYEAATDAATVTALNLLGGS